MWDLLLGVLGVLALFYAPSALIWLSDSLLETLAHRQREREWDSYRQGSS